MNYFSPAGLLPLLSILVWLVVIVALFVVFYYVLKTALIKAHRAIRAEVVREQAEQKLLDDE